MKVRIESENGDPNPLIQQRERGVNVGGGRGEVKLYELNWMFTQSKFVACFGARSHERTANQELVGRPLESNTADRNGRAAGDRRVNHDRYDGLLQEEPTMCGQPHEPCPQNQQDCDY